MPISEPSSPWRSDQVVPPDAKGISGEKLRSLHSWLEDRMRHRAIRAVSLAVARGNALVDLWTGGRLRGGAAEPSIHPRTRFLVASLTKPVSAAGIMKLAEQGALALTTHIGTILPGFDEGGRERIRVWHLLTHTSGLPDMLTGNLELRERRAGLRAYFDGVRRWTPSFEPGTQVRYQSMGFLALAMLAERISGITFREFLQENVFRPAGMTDSHLGLSEDDTGENDAEVDLPPAQRGTQWHWNSRYWRCLGAPWGGLTSTAADLTAFLHIFANEGRAPNGRQVLSPATVEVMMRDWLTPMGSSFAPWGLGWKIRGHTLSDHPGAAADTLGWVPDPAGIAASPESTYSRSFLGDLVSSDTIGHDGITGCAMWMDPRLSLSVAILTSSPAVLRDNTLQKIANRIVASLEHADLAKRCGCNYK